MANPLDAKEFRAQMQRLEFLIQEADRFPDAEVRVHTREVVRTLLDLHAAGLESILEKIAESGESGLALIDTLARDDLVAGLLLLYGLHPVDLETRVRQALTRLEPVLDRHHQRIELIGIADGVVRLRLKEVGHGCSSPGTTLSRIIEEAIYEKAPDVTAIEMEGVVEPVPSVASTFIPVDQLHLKNETTALAQPKSAP